MPQALVIDDCSVTRAVLVRLLSQLGYQVVEASNGREGLEGLKRMPTPTFVLVDWSMPEMNGLDFIQAVRAEGPYHDLPILMATSETELSHVAKALAVGANEYVMKPFTKAMIRDKLALVGVEPH
jgi:two-component system chemotaxis response regulator CheY